MTTAVIYTRYSTDRQRDTSIEDQARNCQRRADDEGWQVVRTFADRAISGSRADRPQYQAMLAAATGGEFQVLLLDDLSRLGRDQVESERAIRRIEFSGVRIVAVSDGYDSTSKARKVQRGVKGLMNELYLDDLREKVHRGQTGQAMREFWCGGRPYGYRLVPVLDETRTDAYGNAVRIGTRLEVDEEQAAVVRDIFERYALGEALRAIAADLNARGVPAPGAHWKRTSRRADGKWLASAIFAMVRNELYRGELIWNRSQWVKDPDTGRRRRRDRPPSEWIRRPDAAPQIVPDEHWTACQERIQRQARLVADRLAAGEPLHKAIGPGRAPKYVLSGLIVCDHCGSKFVVVDRYRYGCSSNHHGGPAACPNDARLSRAMLQKELPAGAERELLSDEAIAEAGRRFARRMREERTPKPANVTKIGELKAEVANIVQAIAGGLNSPALSARLAAAESELARLQDAAPRRPRVDVAKLVPRIADEYRRMVRRLAETINETDPARGRAAMRELIGEVRVIADEREIRLVSRHAGVERALRKAAGAPCQTNVVAGAGNEVAREVAFFSGFRDFRPDDTPTGTRYARGCPDVGGTFSGHRQRGGARKAPSLNRLDGPDCVVPKADTEGERTTHSGPSWSALADPE